LGTDAYVAYMNFNATIIFIKSKWSFTRSAYPTSLQWSLE